MQIFECAVTNNQQVLTTHDHQNNVSCAYRPNHPHIWQHSNHCSVKTYVFSFKACLISSSN